MAWKEQIESHIMLEFDTPTHWALDKARQTKMKKMQHDAVIFKPSWDALCDVWNPLAFRRTLVHEDATNKP